MLGQLVNNDMLLMWDKDAPWRAPEYAKEYFKENRTVTSKFPDCIDTDSKEEDEEEDDDDEDEIEKIKLRAARRAHRPGCYPRGS